MEHIEQCPLCGSKQSLSWQLIADYSISHESFKLVDCATCGFRYTNPRPSSSTLGKYYEGEVYISHSNASHTALEKLYQLARKVAVRNKFSTIHRVQPHGKVLDIGCGTGEFLAYLMSRGYLTTGVEPSITAREQAIANHGIEVLPNLELVPAREQFQVITMWHVLEHVANPRATFKRLFGLLSTGGLLVIAVPDRGSWDAVHYGISWAAWDVPRHLSHFRQTDVHKLLHEHGFEIVGTRRMWMDAPYIAILSERYNGRSALMSILVGAIIGAWSNVMSLVLNKPTSSSLYLAKKTGV